MDGAFLLILVMFLFVYLLLIRPQRQQQRRHTEMIDGLKVGDEVITAGGIYGDVTEVQPDRISLQIAEDVEIEVAKRAIANVIPPQDAAEADLEPAEGEPEAEAEPGARAVEPTEEETARR